MHYSKVSKFEATTVVVNVKLLLFSCQWKEWANIGG